MKRDKCEKGGEHDPVYPDNLLDVIARNVVCSKCGAVGHRSNGRRKYGRPSRIFWHDAGRTEAEGGK